VEWLLVVCVNLLGKLSFGDSASPPPWLTFGSELRW
jgi:hypothetical protein